MIKDLVEILEVTPVSMSVSLKSGVITMSIIPLKMDTDIPPVHITGTPEELDEPGALTEIIEKVKQKYMQKGISANLEDLEKDPEEKPKSAPKKAEKTSKKSTVEPKVEDPKETEKDTLLDEDGLSEAFKKQPVLLPNWLQIKKLVAQETFIAAKGQISKLITKVKGSEIINSLQAYLDKVSDLQANKEKAAEAELLKEGESAEIAAPVKTTENVSAPAVKNKIAEPEAEQKEEEDPFSDEEEYQESEVPPGELKAIKPNPDARKNVTFVPDVPAEDDEENPFN